MVWQLMDALTIHSLILSYTGLLQRMTAVEETVAEKMVALKHNGFGPAQQEAMAATLLANVLAKVRHACLCL